MRMLLLEFCVGPRPAPIRARTGGGPPIPASEALPGPIMTRMPARLPRPDAQHRASAAASASGSVAGISPWWPDS